MGAIALEILVLISLKPPSAIEVVDGRPSMIRCRSQTMRTLDVYVSVAFIETSQANLRPLTQLTSRTIR